VIDDCRQPATRGRRHPGADQDDRDHDADTGAERLRGKQFEEHALERSRRLEVGTLEKATLRLREKRRGGRTRRRVVGGQRQADPRVALAVSGQRRRPASP
jgi:hypothetical protein